MIAVRRKTPDIPKTQQMTAAIEIQITIADGDIIFEPSACMLDRSIQIIILKIKHRNFSVVIFNYLMT